jgi:hypothetical protein
VNDSAGPDPPVSVDLPSGEPAPPPRPVRDVWDKVQILVQPLGGLFTAFAIAMLGFKSSEFLNRRQAIETNTRLYSELMSKREESESALRKDMFQTIIGSFVNASGKGDLDASVLNLEPWPTTSTSRSTSSRCSSTSSARSGTSWRRCTRPPHARNTRATWSGWSGLPGRSPASR